MRIALASPRIAASIDDGLDRVRSLVADAAGRGADIVSFPEAYVPGLRGLDFDVPAFTRADQDRVLAAAADFARTSRIAVIFGTELVTDAGRQIAAAVFDAAGRPLGVQTKTQIDPSEDAHYAPGRGRRLFELNGLKFGIAICHEGWRYPETVRWAAVRGAKVVFHPQHTGYDREGSVPAGWVPPGGAYYEQAMGMRGAGEHGLLCQRELRAPLPGVGDVRHRPDRRPRRGPAVRRRGRAGDGPGPERGDGVAGEPLCPGAVRRNLTRPVGRRYSRRMSNVFPPAATVTVSPDVSVVAYLAGRSAFPFAVAATVTR
jgi:predicted amidohydrolase